MSLEQKNTAIKIDLNNGLTQEEKDKLNLLPQQLQAFKEFLETKKEKEKLGIIYLTQDELKKLKEVLSTQEDTNDEADFIREQANETITSSELFEGSRLGKYPQILEFFENKAYEEIKDFNGLPNLTEDARRNFATGMTLWLLSFMDENIIDNLSGNIDKNKQIFNEKIKEIFNTQLNLKDIKYQDNGENNEIFMNPLKAKEFLEQVINGQNPQKLLQKAKKNEKVQVQISEKEKEELRSLGNKFGEIFDKLPKAGASMGIIDQLSQNKEKASKAISELLSQGNPAVIDFLKSDNFFSNFIRKILKFFEIDLDEVFDKSSVKKIKEIMQNQVTDDEFNDLIIKKEDLNSFFTNLDKDDKGLEAIKKVAEIMGTKIYKKKFLLKLFDKEGILKDIDINTDGKIDYNKFITKLNEYIKAKETKEAKEKDEKTKEGEKSKTSTKNNSKE